jgi:hypothetical protein
MFCFLSMVLLTIKGHPWINFMHGSTLVVVLTVRLSSPHVAHRSLWKSDPTSFLCFETNPLIVSVLQMLPLLMYSVECSLTQISGKMHRLFVFSSYYSNNHMQFVYTAFKPHMRSIFLCWVTSWWTCSIGKYYITCSCNVPLPLLVPDPLSITISVIPILNLA